MSKGIKWQRFWKRFKAIIILIIAVIAFGIMGLFQQSGLTSTGGAAAQVNGEAISIADFRREVSGIEQRFGMNLNSLPEQQRSMFMNRMYDQALNELVVKELVSQVADSEGIFIPDEQVAGFILDIPAFQLDGQFNRESYENYLSAIRSTPAEFEESLRKSFLYSRLQGIFAMSVAPSQAELELVQKGKDTKLNIEFLKFNVDSMVNHLPQSEVLEFSKGADAASQISAYYDSNKAEYTKGESVKAKHILAQFGKEKDADKKAKEKIEKAKVRLEKEDFAVVAKEMSDDTLSAQKGGDLGFFERGKMVPTFEEAAFKAPLNKVVGPIKSSFGYHLILVEEKKAEEVKPLEEVKLDIAKILLKKERAKVELENFTKIVGEGNYSKVKAWTKGKDLQWETTGLFSLDTQSVPKIGPDFDLIEPVLAVQKGELLNKVLPSAGFKYVFFLKDLQKSSTKMTDEIATELKSSVTQQSFRALFQNWIGDQVKKAKVVKNPNLIQSQI